MWWECVHGGARAAPKSAAARAAGIDGPGKRWGHTCNAVSGGKLLYVFGGYGCDNSQTNDVHVFDTVKKIWSKPLMKGTPPSPRDSHSCTTVRNRLFVFGGTDGTNPLKDLHVLDTSSNTWIVPAVTGEGPAAREGHSATLVDKRLFIFGGCGKSRDTQQEEYYNDLYILDTENLTWERATTSGTPPSPRDSHTCSSWNKKIIVLGGEDQSDCYLSDVYMLDADTLVWKQVNTSGQMLAPRAGHTTVLLGSNLFVFGGFTDARNLYNDLHVLNVGTSTWSRVVTLNRGPSARFSVAGDCIDERRGIIVFIGGCNKHLEALDDMYSLHTTDMGDDGLAVPMLENTSVRRVLNKCRGKNLLTEEPEKNNNAHMLGLKSDPSLPMYLQACSQAGITSDGSRSTEEVPFEATITDVNQFGYTIETSINGQVLRGVLLSSPSSSNQDGQTYPNKGRMGTDSEGNKPSDGQPLLKTVRITPQETKSSDQEKIAATYTKESASKTSPVEILAVGLTNSTTSVGACQPNMVSVHVSACHSLFKVSDNVVPPPLSSRDLRCESENVEPSTIPCVDMMTVSENSNISLIQDTETETQIPEPLSVPSEGTKIDSEKLEPLPVPPEDMNVTRNMEPPSMPSEILKKNGISDEPRKMMKPLLQINRTAFIFNPRDQEESRMA